MTDIKNVLIVGGGPGGLTLATALAQKNISCEIVEAQAEGEWGPAGAGLELHGNALKALDMLGIGGDMINAGFIHSGTFMRNKSGDVLAELDFKLMNKPEYHPPIGIIRSRMHDVLKGAAQRENVPIKLGCTVDALRQEADRVNVTFSDGREGVYDLVIGADGVNSKVRALAIGEIAPFYLGYVIIRTMIPRNHDLTHWSMYLGVGKRFLINPCSEDQLYVAGCINVVDDGFRTSEQIINLWKNSFTGFGGDVPYAIDCIKDSSELIYNPIRDLDNDKWINGRVAVIGDAAHATSPNIAQGAAMAIEDAVVLADELCGDGSVEDRLTSWFQRRYARAIGVTRMSRAMGARMQDPSPLTMFMRHQMMRFRGSQAMAQRQGALLTPF